MPNQKQKSKRNMSTGQSTLEDYKMSGDPKYRGLFPSVPKYFDSESKSWLDPGSLSQFYGEEKANIIMDNSPQEWTYFLPKYGWTNLRQIQNWEETAPEIIKEIMPDRLSDSNNKSKSIDDIIKSSDVTQFLSAAMSDKTNTDTPYNLRPDISKYSSDDPLDLLFKMKNTERKSRMTPNELLMILKEAQAPKPVIS